MNNKPYIESQPTFSLIGNIVFFSLVFLFVYLDLHNYLYQNIKVLNDTLFSFEEFSFFYNTFTQNLFYVLLTLLSCVAFEIIFFRTICLFLNSYTYLQFKGNILQAILLMTFLFVFYNFVSFIVVSILGSFLLLKSLKTLRK